MPLLNTREGLKWLKVLLHAKTTIKKGELESSSAVDNNVNWYKHQALSTKAGYIYIF